MHCPICNAECVHWSDSSLGSYGYACLECLLFWSLDSGQFVSQPLKTVPFPLTHRNIPLYREAVGWMGP